MQRRFIVRSATVLLLALIAMSAADGWLRPLSIGVLPAGSAQENAPAAAAPAAAPANDAKQLPKQQNMLAWFFGALGWRYTISFFFLSFCMVALVVMNILAARRDSICPTALLEQFEAHLNEKRYQEAYELAKSDESFLGKVLSAGLAKLSNGYEKAAAAM